MNVDLIKFVGDDSYMTIYSTKDWWQYLHHLYSATKDKEIFLIDHFHERIVQPYNDLTDIISTILNHPHQAKVIDMIRYMKGKKK